MGTVVAGALPGPVSRGLAEAAEMVAAHLPSQGPRREVVTRNLRLVCGPGVTGRRLGRMVDATFCSYGRYWAESLRLPALAPATVDAGMSCAGIEHLEAALDAGRGAILALPHLGGWEWGGTWLAVTGRPVTAVVEALQPPGVFEWFSWFRRRLGMEIVPVGPAAGAAALAALQANRVLCLVCDRVVGGATGVDVRFFGERATLPAGPVTLSLRTGAPLLPAAVYFGRATDQHYGVIAPPLAVSRRGRLREDVASGTQQLAAELEALVRRAPTQWHLMHPNWPGEPCAGGGAGGRQ